jgi:hypothetical protein
LKKINQILQKWPPGTVITTNWLEKQGVYRQLVDNYKNSGWLEPIGPGAYKRKGDTVEWPGGLYALQTLQDIQVHVGGKTALELHGYGHYIRMGNNRLVVVWKTPDVRLPSWFVNYDWSARLEIRSATLFGDNVNELTKRKVENIELTVSSAEQSILEYLHDVPKHEGIDEANYIMEGLSSLRPSVLQKLLEGCKSVKVKRLFLYMAEHHNHAWFKRLDQSSIDLGSGKREIVKGGILDKKYKIVVPNLSREER